MKNNKKKVMSIIGIALLILLIIGVTYAYFAAQDAEIKTRDVRIITDTTDSLVFEIGKDLSITANQDIFSQGKGNQTDSTTAKAILRANNTTNSATDNYYLYIDISSNDFEYTTSEKTAELILTITKPDKTPLTSIEGLTPVTVNGVSGFDITEASGIIKIAENKEIIATSANNNTTTDEWEIEITFINLETNQASNGGKSIEAKIKMQKTKEETLAEYIKSLYTTDGVNGLYLHDGIGTYTNANLEAADNSYRYSGGGYSIAEDYKTIFSSVDNEIIKKSCNEIDILVTEYCQPKRNGANLDRDNFYYYLSYDENKTPFKLYQDAFNKAQLDGFIVNNKINNFVCFGSDAENCPADNLYRIIGVFEDKVKLIKYDYATLDLLGTDGDYIETKSGFQLGYYQMRDISLTRKIDRYAWNNINYNKAYEETGKYNLWIYSALNKINLNTNFLNNIGKKWDNKIAMISWNTGGISREIIESSNVKNVYDHELSDCETCTGKNENSNAKIGLMYVSEYFYAMDSSYWEYSIKGSSNSLEYVNLLFDNWLYMDFVDWTISNYADISHAAVNVINGTAGYGIQGGEAIRPTFYLKPNIKYLSGNGTELDPYRIA